ncbi:hypothetical protein BV22DRAFT_965329, partial [Leucogyrophana mollusca]
QIHPYAKMAWSVLSLAHKTIIAQGDRDDMIRDLVEMMNDMYQCILEAMPLEANSVEKVINLMVQQTIECACFICSY